ncbi:MAG: hypothetical protein IGS48_23760 [Oscillatoriales cyanobacterium C42_A2020_001]|nr:hypothetical protein [Leptolyngbyaceae cyanobacterium C42_A2020_001]
MHTMLVTAKYASRVLVSTMVGVGLLLGIAQMPTTAQTGGRPSPLEDLQTKDGSDFFNGRSNGQTGSVMNFIQNAIIGAPRSLDEFTADQQENFNDATARFRKQQADRLRKQEPQNSPTLQVAPLPANSSPASP